VASDAPARPKRVLVVDDERVIADTLTLIFRKAGYQAEAVYNGRDAVQRAREFEPDIVVSDVVMPEMDGIEAVSLMSNEKRPPAVLLISGQAEGEYVIERVQHRFEIVAKPIHPELLLERVARMTAKAAAAAHGAA
jgi:DNA-binding response OmpR family regulator